MSWRNFLVKMGAVIGLAFVFGLFAILVPMRTGRFSFATLDNAELMRIALPALRADAHLYRQYVYEPSDPLAIRIYGYGGRSDRNISREHLQRWCELTTAECSIEQFEGGHFFFQTAQSDFLRSLASKL